MLAKASMPLREIDRGFGVLGRETTSNGGVQEARNYVVLRRGLRRYNSMSLKMFGEFAQDGSATNWANTRSGRVLLLVLLLAQLDQSRECPMLKAFSVVSMNGIV